MTPPPPAALDRRQTTICLLGALALSFAAYSTSLQGQFVHDDIPHLVHGSCHRGLHRIPALFDPTNQTICSLRPMRLLSFTLDHALWGDRPLGYHLTNVVLHALVGWLALLVLLQLGVDRRSALLAGAFFLLHPVATEAVAYVSGRRDLLMALFSLLVAHAYLSFQSRGGWPRLLLAAFAMVAAIWSHEAAAVLPAALVVLELGRAEAGVSRRAALVGALQRLLTRRRLIPLGLLLLISGALTLRIVWTRNFSDRQELWGGELPAHLATVLRVHLHYLRQLAWPDALIADYSPEAFRVSHTLLEPAALLATAVVVGLLALAWVLLPRWPRVSVALVCYFVLLLPVSQIVIHHELLAEHRLYLASLCFAGLLGAAASAATRRAGRTAWGLVGAVALVYLVLTNSRNLDWRTPLSLWSVTVRQVPRCARAHSNLGAALATLGRYDAARTHLDTALRIRPDLCGARLNRGQLLLDTGHRAGGLQELQRAAACSPTPAYLKPLGFAALAQKRLDLAERALRRALTMAPHSADLRFGLGTVLHRRGDRPGALRQYRLAATRRKRWPKLLYRTAVVLAESCEIAAAERATRRFLRLWHPGSAEERRLRRLLRQARSRCGR